MSKQSSNPQMKEKKMNPLLWFFFVVLVPTIVAMIIAIVILSIAGVNVGEWVKKTGSNIPVISSFIQTEEEKSIEELENKLAQTIEAKDREIAELESTIEQQIHDIEKRTEELEEAEQQLLSSVNTEEIEQELKETTQTTIKEMAASFQKMNHNQAAKIIEEMDRALALTLLSELPNDVRGKIIEKMDADKAIKITEEYMRITE